MKKILTLILATYLGLTGFQTKAQESFKEANIEAHEANLGTEPEEFLRDGVSTFYHNNQQVNIPYATDVENGIHAILNDGKTFFMTGFNQYTNLEKEVIDSYNGGGVRIDTVTNKVYDHNDNFISSFSSTTDLYNVIDSLLKTIGEDIDVQPVGINENEKILKEMYPNPTIGDVNLVIDKDKKNLYLEIYNPSGKLIYQRKIEDVVGNLKVDMSKYAAGMYFFRISDGKESTTQKVIKQ